MGKKAINKRIRITRTGKVMRRPMGVNHFKTKKTGSANRKKRHNVSVKWMDKKSLINYV